MVSAAGTQANVCTKKSTAPHNHFTTLFFLLVQSSLSILCRNAAGLFTVFNVHHKRQCLLCVTQNWVLCTILKIVETEGSFLTAAQSTAGQRGDGAEELMWRQALLPLCLTVAHHLFPIYCSVSLMTSLPPFSDGISQDGVPCRQACSPLIQLFFGFASEWDIDIWYQSNKYRSRYIYQRRQLTVYSNMCN